VPLAEYGIGRTVDHARCENVSQSANGQDWETFTILAPGAAGNNSFGNARNPGQVAAVNGNLRIIRPRRCASTTLPSSANSDIPSREVSELQVNTSSFSASMESGGVIFKPDQQGCTTASMAPAMSISRRRLNAANYGSARRWWFRFCVTTNYGVRSAVPSEEEDVLYFNYDKIDQNSESTTAYDLRPQP